MPRMVQLDAEVGHSFGASTVADIIDEVRDGYADSLQRKAPESAFFTRVAARIPYPLPAWPPHFPKAVGPHVIDFGWVERDGSKWSRVTDGDEYEAIFSVLLVTDSPTTASFVDQLVEAIEKRYA